VSTGVKKEKKKNERGGKEYQKKCEAVTGNFWGGE